MHIGFVEFSFNAAGIILASGVAIPERKTNNMNDSMMKVSGEAMLSIPIFVIKKFGRKAYNQWLDSISPEARKVYSNPISKSDWYPLKKMMIEPTKKICELFYNNSLRGGWDCGRYSAEYGLKGIYKILVKLRSPQVLIKKGSSILSNYYKPSDVEVLEQTKSHVIVRILKFPEITPCLEYRMAGWMERAVEISGCNHVSVDITKSLTKDDPYTEFNVRWK